MFVLFSSLDKNSFTLLLFYFIFKYKDFKFGSFFCFIEIYGKKLYFCIKNIVYKTFFDKNCNICSGLLQRLELNIIKFLCNIWRKRKEDGSYEIFFIQRYSK